MKHLVLDGIIDTFEKWQTQQPNLLSACKKGCSTCCTQNVTITALEGEKILRYILENGKERWFAERLFHKRSHTPAQYTTNEFAKACLEQRDLEQNPTETSAPCPFLEGQLCSIYPVRPFSCRLFISTTVCDKNKVAQVPDYYLEASTAVSQLLEHLGQKEYWGNMLDVLPALLDISEFMKIGAESNQTLIMHARLQTKSAQPLPSFLLSEENSGKVTHLLESIFCLEVEGKTVEDILNGR